MKRTTPSIRISDHLSSKPGSHCNGQSLYDNASPAIATPASMAIPRAREAVPPPLPPPQFIPELSSGRDPGWQWANDPSASDFARPASVKPGSSLLGGFHSAAAQDLDGQHVRRTSSTSTITPPSREVEMTNIQDDESASSNPHRSFKSERRLERSTFEDLSQKYDKHLVSKIGGPNTPSKQSLSGSSIQDAAMQERERRNSLLPALGQSHESARWLPSMSPNGAISPGVGPAWDSHGHTRHNSIQSERPPIDSHHQEDFPMDDANPREQDVFGGFRAGDKRRASSPPRDRDDSRRQPTLREAPSGRFHPGPGHASLSSVSSYGGHRHGSLSSSVGLSSVPSSATSYASGIISPLAASIKESDLRGAAAEIASSALHQRTASELTQVDQKGSPGHRGHSRQNSRSTTITQGLYVCECCPKKPKKYETEEELRLHESEKQYGCNYCPNRFKNKNEAERHQNSLHLRDHSWSCAALTNYEAAFHTSTSGADVDICGYCGLEFPNPADWKHRFEHLTVGHKVGQCNRQKKFFRADHFRQHLKHTHDGTSGKWTNMLENACMKNEPRHPQQLEEPPSFPPSTRIEYIAQPSS